MKIPLFVDVLQDPRDLTHEQRLILCHLREHEIHQTLCLTRDEILMDALGYEEPMFYYMMMEDLLNRNIIRCRWSEDKKLRALEIVRPDQDDSSVISPIEILSLNI